MDDKKLLSIVDAEFDSALGSPGGEISTDRAKAWNYYMSKALGNEIDGQSQVVSSDVSDVIDGIMPSLLRLFTTSDNLVSFDPVSSEDVEGAEQETDFITYVFFKENPAFLLLFYWFFDALVQKNGIVKAWWDESETVSTESYEGLTEQALIDLLDDEELEAISKAEREGETVIDGEVVETTLYDVTFRRVCKYGRAKVDNVPPEEYRISGDSRSLDPTGARMVGQERLVKRSDLLDMGFDKDVVDSLPADLDTNDSEEKSARRDKSEEGRDTPKEKSQDEIRVRECYIKVDYDGDGRAELREVIAAGNKVLYNELVDRQPFHVICPQPLPHKHFGIASAEKVMDIQQKSSTLERQILDNLYHTNNPGHAVWEQAVGENTLDDLLTTRAGRVARFARPVGESYAPLTVPFTAGASFPMLEYYEKKKQDRTGVRSDAEGLDPDALKNIQQSVLASATDMSKMKIEMIARVFSETGIKSLFLHLHELVLKHQQKPKVVKLRNKWVEVNPTEWRSRMDMTVNVGLGVGTRDQNLIHLNDIWTKQTAIIQGGGQNILVKPRHVYNVLSESVKNANYKDPAMFFADPGDADFPEQSSEQVALMKQQQELDQRQQQLDAERQSINRERESWKQQKDMAEYMQKNKTHQDEMELKWAEREDRLTIALEQIATKLTELELQDAQNAIEVHEQVEEAVSDSQENT